MYGEVGGITVLSGEDEISLWCVSSSSALTSCSLKDSSCNKSLEETEVLDNELSVLRKPGAFLGHEVSVVTEASWKQLFFEEIWYISSWEFWCYLEALSHEDLVD